MGKTTFEHYVIFCLNTCNFHYYRQTYSHSVHTLATNKCYPSGCFLIFFSYSIEYRVKKGEFRVIKVEYRVIKVEYRVIKVEYRVMKVEFRVIKVEYRVIKSEYRVIKVEYRVIKSEYRVIKSEYRVIKSEYRVIKQNKKTIGCSTRSHTWLSHGIKKTYFKKSHDK